MDRGFEIISTVRRRRSWTPEEKVAILDAAFSPGGSVAAASDRYDVARSLIYLWRRQAREGGIPGVGVVEPPAAKFAPVQIANEGQRTASGNVVGQSSSSSRVSNAAKCRSAATIEIALINGRMIKVRDTIDPALLAGIIDVLDGKGDA